MAKQGDLWDDSVLVTAFNEAISSYKETENEKSDPQPNIGTEVGESSDNPSSGKGNQRVESVDPNAPDSHAEICGDAQKNHSHSQASQDYNELLNQYHELERKRQEIVNQLYQCGAWNYQYPNEAYGYGMQSANGSNPNTVSSCCPYTGQCFAAPCTSVPSYCLAPPCADPCEPTGHKKSTVPREDSDIVETAMGAAERAMSSLKMKIADNSVLNEANKEKENDTSETDLTEVLNAWYSAGFFTGKYLVEQSTAKRRQS